MKHTIVLPTYQYNEERLRLATETFQDLAQCDVPEGTELMLVEKELGSVAKRFNYSILEEKFKIQQFQDPEGVSGTEMTLAWGTEEAFRRGAEYVTWMGDDAKFHPYWLHRLMALIGRHPEALAWSVYRSAHEVYHTPIRTDEYGDVLVRSICGHGFTIRADAWKAWGVSWREGSWPCDRGDTLDLHHTWKMPGERWVTGRSYVDHTGKVGVHVQPHIPEYAIDFVEA